METREQEIRTINGWLMFFVLLGALVALGYMGYRIIAGAIHASEFRIGQAAAGWWIAAWLLLDITWLVLMVGFFTLAPNMAAVLTLFGKYRGSIRTSGFHWANPFFNKQKISLRAHNLNGERLKVNDLRGNPIEIANVIVWRVVDTAKAAYDVENYGDYVRVQSESALRHLALSYPYDTYEGDTTSLRGSVDEVSGALQREVQDRVARAGVLIEEARISHLAYAAEIAGAMLQRQQADAVVAARQRIVDGAVGMVEMALAHLEGHKTIKLDDERRAAMVSNLLVVLCGDRAVHPVINAGTIY